MKYPPVLGARLPPRLAEGQKCRSPRLHEFLERRDNGRRVTTTPGLPCPRSDAVAIQSQLDELVAADPDAAALQQPGTSALERFTAWETKILQIGYETYEDEDHLPGRLVKQVRHLLQS